MSIVDEIQSTHSKSGYYCIEVLLSAIIDKGMILEQLNMYRELGCSELRGSASNPVRILLGNRNEHYIAIRVYNDHAIVLDSLRRKPTMISEKQLLTYIETNSTLVYKLKPTVLLQDNSP